MQLSVSSGKDGILQHATFLTFGDSLDHTADYPLADMVSSANRWVQTIASWIWQSSSTWEFDDNNQTGLPIYRATIVDNQRDYTLPTTVFKLIAVEVLLSDGTTWQRVRQVDRSEQPGIGFDSDQTTKGIPSEYDVVGASLIFNVPLSTSLLTATNGIKIYVTREATTFTVPANYTTADTTQPGFDEAFHEIVCKGIAYDYCVVNKTDIAANLLGDIDRKHADLNKHYFVKNADKKVGIRPRIERYS